MSEPSNHRQTVLFLCTGNYYRSRFAAVLFDALAVEAGLAWRADSRGVAIELGIHNTGPISPHARAGLAQRGIDLPTEIPYPHQAQEQELEAADLVIAIKEAEHRPLLEARYPRWPDQVEYWHIHDLDGATPQEALAELEENIRALVARLSPETDVTKEGKPGARHRS